MKSKIYVHKLTIDQRRRENKKSYDILSKDFSKGALQYVYDAYYKNQAKALYRAISR